MVKGEYKVALVIHDVRSALNVGSMLRTAEGLGIDKVFTTGYTPYPEAKNDERLPHHRRRTASQIHKTALGAEDLLDWKHVADINDCLAMLLKDNYSIMALEQTPEAIDLDKFKPTGNVALIVGNEVRGLKEPVLKQVSLAVQIPMRGRKESFNVAVAAAIALYQLRLRDLEKKT